MIRAKTFALLTPSGKFVQAISGGRDLVGGDKPTRFYEADDLASASVFTLAELHPLTGTIDGVTTMAVDDKIVQVTLVEAYVTRTVTVGIRPE